MKIWRITAWKKALKVNTENTVAFCYMVKVFVCLFCFCSHVFSLLTDKPGAKGDGKKAKKASVSKPNSIKSMFMNSNVKKPAEVRDHVFYCIIRIHVCIFVKNNVFVFLEKCRLVQR